MLPIGRQSKCPRRHHAAKAARRPWHAFVIAAKLLPHGPTCLKGHQGWKATAPLYVCHYPPNYPHLYTSPLPLVQRLSRAGRHSLPQLSRQWLAHVAPCVAHLASNVEGPMLQSNLRFRGPLHGAIMMNTCAMHEPNLTPGTHFNPGSSSQCMFTTTVPAILFQRGAIEARAARTKYAQTITSTRLM